MSGTRRVTLKPGDLIYWEPGENEDGIAASVLQVADNNTDLLFQFAPKPWHELQPDGYTRVEAEQVLNGEKPFELPGYIWKAYDEETGRSFVNPRLLEPGEDL